MSNIKGSGSVAWHWLSLHTDRSWKLQILLHISPHYMHRVVYLHLFPSKPLHTFSRSNMLSPVYMNVSAILYIHLTVITTSLRSSLSACDPSDLGLALNFGRISLNFWAPVSLRHMRLETFRHFTLILYHHMDTFSDRQSDMFSSSPYLRTLLVYKLPHLHL